MLDSMLSIVHYWLHNAIRFLWENIRSWCVICVCLQRESELGVTQELALQSKGLAQVRYFCSICDLSRNISVVPNPQFPATLALIWPSHIDLSLVSPFPSTTTANSMRTRQTGDMHTFSSHGYYCVVRRHEFISLPPNAFPPALLQNMCLLTSPASSTSSTPSFLFIIPQFFVFFHLFM